MKVLIADDEAEVLKGLKHIINWEALGCTICGEAVNGTDALKKIQILKPDIVLLDIRMPGLTGLEIIQQARDFQFPGRFIILSGYSDFTYAQSAVKLGVDNYLVKPVDEDELAEAVTKVRNSMEKSNKKEQILHQYRENARDTIILNLITEKANPFSFDLADLHLLTDQYMVILYEHYNQNSFDELWDFADLLRVGNQNHTSFEHITIEKHEVILLKGSNSIERFYRLLDHYNNGLQKGSPLDSLFLIYGRPVEYINELGLSYQDTLMLLKRRFFCEESQHVLGYQDLPPASRLTGSIEKLKTYPRTIAGYIQAHNRSALAETLMDLEKVLYYSNDNVAKLKRELIDIFLQVKHIVHFAYPASDIPFPSNTRIMEFIMSKYYLYEIIHFFSEQFEMSLKAIGCSNSEDIMDDVLYYINHNFSENLRLESIAPLFGYNSSYLGKVFTRKVGENFNAYLDRVRIQKAKELLASNHYKVYEISEKVGYSNADYFHKKFKKYTNTTPAEYRKSLLDSSPE